MEYIKSKDLFVVSRDVLRLIHPRPIDHGSRVAYMVYKMLQEEGQYEEFELADIVMVVTFHDIGAYKTERGEINDILRYESRDSMAHSIYGYLFMRYLSPVPDLAKIIMYHHRDHEHLLDVDYEYKKIAEYVNIAEKMDIYSTTMGSQFDLFMFDKQAGTKISKEGLDHFYTCEAKYGMFEKLQSGEYRQELDEITDYMIFNNEDKDKFLEMLMYCLGFRSESVVVDTVTTVCICEEIADKMMLPDTEKELLHYAALIHDIGMLALPQEIIEASRKLEPDEVKLVRTHVEIAGEELSGKMDNEIVSIALTHHEREDGSGYPLRLQGGQMSMPQKILQVADVVSALINKRSYRDALPKEKVVAILNEEVTKKRLKRQVVNAFLSSYDSIVQHVKEESAEILKMYQTLNLQYDQISKKYKI
jgi:HD-GYP domain-containing protein (c-di-GMP phosphodiesterase class II)